MVRRKRNSRPIVGLLLILIVVAVYYLCYPTDTVESPTDPSSGVPTRTVSDPSQLDGELIVSFIDVGQGDSILVEQGGHRMLIDCGPRSSSQQLLDYLESREVSALDSLVLTHPHEDHIGGAVDVINTYPISAVYMPNKAHTSATYGNTLEAMTERQLTVTLSQAGDSFTLGAATVEVLGPTQIYSDLNNCSLVLRLTYKDTCFLFTGDAEAQSEADMLVAGANLEADLLKVGHHGSSTSTYQDFLDAVAPSIAVISCGADNDYGHPHGETLAALDNRGVAVFRTDQQGTIIAVSDGQSITMYTEGQL